MFDEMEKAPPILQVGSFWKKSYEEFDLEHFKDVLVQKNSNSFSHLRDPRFRFLHSNVRKNRMILTLLQTLVSPQGAEKVKKKSRSAIYLTRLLWEYLLLHLPSRLLEIEEPAIGNPMWVKWRNRMVTEDLGNSLLEFHTLETAIDLSTIHTVFELGAGYGRLAFVFLKQLPAIKYIVADFPPNLFIAQNYLGQLFAERKIFHFRPFKEFAEIQSEFEEASLCFFLPHQLEKLPSQSIDLGISIGTLDEMTRGQIAYYFSQFDHLLSGYFYFKQRKASYLPQHKMTILEADYPVPVHWEELFWHPSPLNPLFFEALLKALHYNVT